MDKLKGLLVSDNSPFYAEEKLEFIGVSLAQHTDKMKYTACISSCRGTDVPCTAFIKSRIPSGFGFVTTNPNVEVTNRAS